MRLKSALAALALVGFAGAATGQSLKPDQVMSSVSVQTISEPNPVLGADDRVHLAYELLIANTSHLFITLDKIEAVEPGGKVLGTQDGKVLAGMTSAFSGTGTTLAPGASAVVLVDLPFAKNDKLPQTIMARLTVTRALAGQDGKPTLYPPSEPLPKTVVFTGATTGIGKPARVVEPPLRGPGWIAVNGCCDSMTSHRGAIMAVNGQLRVPERFAIDWIKVDAEGRVYTGDMAKLESYAYYGAPIHAVADGTVVNLYNEADEQIPGKISSITTENIGGNMMVIDIGDGAYAFYAHMQRDSLKFKLGDKVKTGDVVGLLGNTGNTTAPHLHFHVMDGTSPLDANSLPYVFTRFSTRGVVQMDDSSDPIEKGDPAKVVDDGRTGEHADQLPLNNQLVDFAD
ncbi:MAG: M23 family metallopeptidase [Rhizobiaceae bacterium]